MLLLQPLTLHVLLCIFHQKAANIVSIDSPHIYRIVNVSLPVPPNRRANSAQMPQRVRIDHTLPRWEIEQLQTHREYNPEHNQPGPSSP